MLPDALVLGAGLIWLGLLFGAALYGDRRPQAFTRFWPAIYALSLAVHCTSWTFYGTVTQASRSGWWLPPTFVGSIVLYLFASGLLERLVVIARTHNSTSLADLIATRLGRNSLLAALITAVAVLGIVPYISLQLKAVAMSYGMLVSSRTFATPAWQDSALYVALLMALFAMLFGTRRASVTEHNRGLVLAMAFESLFKLGAMLALGAMVLFGLHVPDVPVHVPPPDGASGFPALVLLGALAMFILPHQFHAGVVECRDPRHVRTARWMFPLYMLLIALPILPLARAGDALLGSAGVSSDLYMLALPLSQGQGGLALLGFLGGLSAATSMVIVATLALSLMIGNHWIAPLRVRAGWGRSSSDLRGEVLIQRRMVILAVVLLAWAYSRALIASDALADIGAISFSALSAIAPAVIVAIYRPQLGARAVGAGLIAGTAIWVYALLLPLLLNPHLAWLHDGPLGIAWLAPDKLAGLGEWSRLSRAVILSLFANVAVLLLVAASRFAHPPASARLGGVGFGELRALATRFLAEQRVQLLFHATDAHALAPESLIAEVEHELAAVIGASSARLLLTVARRERSTELETVAVIVGEASRDLRFNQRVLEAALENMSQGISVVDRDLNVVAWNQPYAELFGYPADVLRVGVPVAELVRHNAARGLVAAQDVDSEVDKRIAHMRAGTPYVAERTFPHARVVEIRGNPMPGGGFVATFTDVTAFRRTEAELKHAAETLEQRVIARTVELSAAKAEAERANQAKTRFLAAISHDLAQPLNAAHLFTHALAQQLTHAQYRDAVNNIDSALNSAEDLLTGLLDMSRLDAGGMAPKRQLFCVDEWLAHLAAEFRVLAREKNLELHYVRCGVWINSDPQLLRRILQNFLANAVRYTERGRILLGCRRIGDSLSIEVWDTGPGIAEANRDLIFEEFRRLDPGGQGLGLGLAIAERIARLLDHPLCLRSRPGHGTVFAIRAATVAARIAVPVIAADEPAHAARCRVLVVDNDPAVLKAMQALLSGWSCAVLSARNCDDAQRLTQNMRPDLLLLDYHLDDGITGLQLRERLTCAQQPCIIITADHSEEVRRAVAANDCHLLYKPLKPLALKSLMARLLAASLVHVS